MEALLSPSLAGQRAGKRTRVMIVDDAVVVRSLICRWLDTESDMEVVASLRNGYEAVTGIERIDPDVVILDIDMPRMDGLTALPQMLAKRRDLVVIMASTLTRRNAEISLKALSLGAKDYIAKPESTSEVISSADFRRDLINKIRQLSERARQRKQALAGAVPPQLPGMPLMTLAAPPLVPALQEQIALRPFPETVPRVLVIGASTGGPQALIGLMPRLGEVCDRAPVLITQHMPPTFTSILAEHLTQASGRPVHEARDGEEVDAGSVYLAPGGKHMTVARRDDVAVVTLDDGPPVRFCKPAVDPLFVTAADVWGHRVAALVLTGMGSDGLLGAKAIVGAGGSVMAQDEASSVVWGMPGQVASAGICSAVLPLSDLAPRLNRLFVGSGA